MHGKLKLRRLLPAVVMFTAVAAAHAEFTAIEALKSAPSVILAPMSKTMVNDLIEYAKAGMLSHSEMNAFGSDARITRLDSLGATLQTGTAGTMSLELLPLKSDTVIAVIETVTTQGIPDSRLTIYSRTWKPLNSLWHEPKASQWGRLDEVPVILADYSYDRASKTLTLTNNSEQKEHMLPALRYVWTNKGFKRLK